MALSDSDLIAGFSDAVLDEREQLVVQLRFLGELDRRKLFFHYESLRAYLMAEHSMEEWLAERRIRAARLLRKRPQLFESMESGKLNLTLLELAQGCARREALDEEEFLQLVDAISGLSCQRAKREIAARYPETSELPKDRVRPLSETHSEIRFVAPQIRGLLAHSHPGIALAELIGLLASEYRERHHPEARARRAQERAEKKKQQSQSESLKEPTATRVEVSQFQSDPVKEPTATQAESNDPQSDSLKEPTAMQAESPEPQSESLKAPTTTQVQPTTDPRGSRLFPDPMIFEMIRRDGYRCAYLDAETGKRCCSQRGLEGDHVIPWAQGGKTEPSNGRLMCQKHHSRVSFVQFREWRARR